MVACRLSIAGCGVTITVDAAAGEMRQDRVATAIEQNIDEFARIAIASLRRTTPSLAEWTVVEPPTLAAPPPPPATPTPVPAVLLVPPPAPPIAVVHADPAAWPKVAAPTAPQRKAPPGTPGFAAAPPMAGLAQAQADRDWDARLAVAQAHGAAVAAALAARPPSCVPKAPPMPPPLRNRVWAAVGGTPELAGFYSRWEDGAAAAAAHQPPCVVRGVASLAEARAFADGAGATLADRRY